MTISKKPETGGRPTEDNPRQAFNSALRILTGRDHSKYELGLKLRQRGFEPQEIEKALSKCIQLDYVNDERTARVYIRQLIRKGYGKKRMRQEMNQKGLRGRQIQRILAEAVSESDEFESMERVLKKHINRFERESDPKKRKEKMYRFLYARGFSQDAIRKIMKKYAA